MSLRSLSLSYRVNASSPSRFDRKVGSDPLKFFEKLCIKKHIRLNDTPKFRWYPCREGKFVFGP